MAETDKLVIGAVEAARIIGVNPRTIQRWATSGQLPPLGKVEGQRGSFVFEAGVVRRKAEERQAKRHPRRAS